MHGNSRRVDTYTTDIAGGFQSLLCVGDLAAASVADLCCVRLPFEMEAALVLTVSRCSGFLLLSHVYCPLPDTSTRLVNGTALRSNTDM